MNRPLHRLWLAPVTFAVIALLRSPESVQAHAFLVSSSPAAGEHTRSSPTTLRLRFTETIAAAGSGRLTLEAGAHRIPLRGLTLGPDGATLVGSLPHLRGGIYLVRWQVVAADDGHLSVGTFAFAVGPRTALAGIADTGAAPTAWLGAVIGWLFLLGLVLGMGSLASELVIWRPLARTQPWQCPALPLRLPLLLALGTGLATFLLLVGTLAPRGAVSPLSPMAWGSALQTRAGMVTALALIFILYALAVSPLRPARASALIVLLMAGAATALRTHPAGVTTAWWAVPAAVIHVVLALVWTGLLLQLVLVLWRQHDAIPAPALFAAVRRYAHLALWSVSLVLLTGLAAAFVELRSPDQLLTGAYGRVLALKGGTVLIGLSLALFGRAAISDHGAERALALVRAVTRPEALMAVTVLALASLLSNTAPPYVPRHSGVAAAATPLGPPPPVGPALTLAGKAGWLEVYLTAAANRLLVRVFTPDDNATPTRLRDLTAQRPGMTRSTVLLPRPCGSGCFTLPFQWSRGSTRVRLRVSNAKWRGGRLSFTVPWPLLPPLRRGLTRVISTMRAQSAVRFTERVSSTPGAAFARTIRLSGTQFVAAEPYSVRLSGVRPLPRRRGQRQLILYLSGSNIWVHLWIGARERIQREVIVDPGHLIQRTFSYPRGSTSGYGKSS